MSAAVVVAGAADAAASRSLVSALTDSVDAVQVAELVDAPIRDVFRVLSRLSVNSAEFGTTLLLFCGHVVRGIDDRLFFTDHAQDAPTPMTAVLVDALADMVASSRAPIVVIIDCEFLDRTGSGADDLRALERLFGASATGVLVSDARGHGVEGGVLQWLVDGIRSRELDRDGDLLVTLDDLFAYARGRGGAAGVPSGSIVTSEHRSKAGGALPLVRLRDPTLPALRGPRPSHVPPALSPLSGRELSAPRPAAPSRAGSEGPAIARPRRLVRPIAAVGVLALGAAAVFGALATGGKSTPRRALPVPVTTPTTTPDVIAASGDRRLAAECARVQAALAVAVATPSPGGSLSASGVVRLDNGSEVHIPLARVSDVTTPSGIEVYVGPVVSFDHAGMLHWKVLLSSRATVRNVALRCGNSAQLLMP
jgi:hypothetical protein